MLSPNTKKLLVITHQESDPGTNRQDYIQLLRQHTQMSQMLRDYFKNGDNVLLSGALEQFDLTGSSCAAKKLETVYKQSVNLINALLPNTLSDEDKKVIIKTRSNAIYFKIKAFLDGLQAEVEAPTPSYEKLPAKTESAPE